LIPRLTLQISSRVALPYPSPLLKEERRAGGFALLLDLEHPFTFHGARAGAGFAADDDPVDVVEGEFGKRAEERLAGEEANGGGDGAEAFDSLVVLGQFDAG